MGVQTKETDYRFGWLLVGMMFSGCAVFLVGILALFQGALHGLYLMIGGIIMSTVSSLIGFYIFDLKGMRQTKNNTKVQKKTPYWSLNGDGNPVLVVNERKLKKQIKKERKRNVGAGVDNTCPDVR